MRQVYFTVPRPYIRQIGQLDLVRRIIQYLLIAAMSRSQLLFEPCNLCVERIKLLASVTQEISEREEHESDYGYDRVNGRPLLPFIPYPMVRRVCPNCFRLEDELQERNGYLNWLKEREAARKRTEEQEKVALEMRAARNQQYMLHGLPLSSASSPFSSDAEVRQLAAEPNRAADLLAFNWEASPGHRNIPVPGMPDMIVNEELLVWPNIPHHPPPESQPRSSSSEDMGWSDGGSHGAPGWSTTSSGSPRPASSSSSHHNQSSSSMSSSGSNPDPIPTQHPSSTSSVDPNVAHSSDGIRSDEVEMSDQSVEMPNMSGAWPGAEPEPARYQEVANRGFLRRWPDSMEDQRESSSGGETGPAGGRPQ